MFVDFTAAWCLTCQVNERLVINTPAAARALKDKNVATLKADWTSNDPAITAALSELGRSGVPAYALYPADRTQPPRLLPEVLTPSVLLSAACALTRPLWPVFDWIDNGRR